ncbi:hypothetical protein ACFE04_027180 [Oxalis oulophora]
MASLSLAVKRAASTPTSLTLSALLPLASDRSVFRASFFSGVSFRPWNAKQDENALYLRMYMLGLGEGEKESGDEEVAKARKVSIRIKLPTNVYQLDEIKAEMKNGGLKVVVPRVKGRQLKNVREINVDRITPKFEALCKALANTIDLRHCAELLGTQDRIQMWLLN